MKGLLPLSCALLASDFTGKITVQDGGTVDVLGTLSIDTLASLDDEGTITAEMDAVLELFGSVIIANDLDDLGAITVESAGMVQIAAGTLSFGQNGATLDVQGSVTVTVADGLIIREETS